MKMKRLASGALGVVVGMVVGAGAWLALSQASPVASDSPSGGTIQDTAQAPLPIPENMIVRTNSSGQTYGSIMVMTVEGRDLPDLVQVIMDDGKVGYVYSDELLGPSPANPDEAVKITLEQQARGSSTVVATDSEGVPIGTFTFSTGLK